jgi:signal transduction histidine kinase
MRERVKLLGGRLTVVSKPGSGARVTAHVQIPRSELE